MATPDCQLWPSNMLVTEPSSKTSLIARAISGAMESRSACRTRFSSAIGSVLVTMISEMAEFFSRSTAGSERTPCVAADDDLGRALLEQRLGRLHDRAAGVDHVVDDDAGPALDLPDDLGWPSPRWEYRGRGACG